MDTVSTKVSRAQQLLASLNAEMVRWRDTSAGFDTQMSTLIGDCLLCAAFTTFGGIFDHKLRKFLFREWSDICESVGIPHQPDLNVVDYLSSPQQQNVWRGFGLPVDELAQQNAICLERFTRYPLIVDPAGQVIHAVGLDSGMRLCAMICLMNCWIKYSNFVLNNMRFRLADSSCASTLRKRLCKPHSWIPTF